MSDDSKEPSRRRRHAPVDASQATHDDEPAGPPTWSQRHAATVMGCVLGGLLIMIMLVQGC